MREFVCVCSRWMSESKCPQRTELSDLLELVLLQEVVSHTTWELGTRPYVILLMFLNFYSLINQLEDT